MGEEGLELGMKASDDQVRKWTGQKLIERIMSTDKDLKAQLQWPYETSGACLQASRCSLWVHPNRRRLDDLGPWWLCILALKDHQETPNAGGTRTGGGQTPITTQTATNPNPSINWNPAINPNRWISNDDTLSNPGATNANSFDMNDLPPNTHHQNPFLP
ncbi:hypothetical protein EPUS_08929 [Endocarpon pusillum Z07020]|uniref:Uncharacterized protein n=1 Tax=Endocarpon pusillum (strain Z07020 / HMAS-L-300199) TaxID=1263415 RepID=U1HGJ0_ENDPU|nr:uncharacterized protein EPUS_08929 [Endocarpon pusillum Z07020]ERF69250.1 hypothetical protein EPUS_08929 [Endocarpon pusillum Z07020]